MFAFLLMSWSRRILALALVVVLAGLLFVAPTYAQGPVAPARLELRANHILGVLPAMGSALAKEPATLGNLDYHNGSVMHTNTVYAIYWIPPGYSVSTNYRALVNGFFKNVVAARGLTSNVYYSDTQYYDGSGNVRYYSVWGGTYTDTHAFPGSGCSNPYTAKCLTDSQIQTEIKRVMGVKLWTPGANKIYFMFTPKNVGSCSGTACAYTDYCGYHSWMYNSSNKLILYANMPYAAWANCWTNSQPKPNGDDADYTISVVSHEQNESITDPTGAGWWNTNNGYENGDNCAWNFGAAIGSTGFGSYNQAIGTGKYYIQQEWSNASTGCVLTGY
ncbi:MAG: hypothetical protein WCF84_13015 [Anaerolineae bacterium]